MLARFRFLCGLPVGEVTPYDLQLVWLVYIHPDLGIGADNCPSGQVQAPGYPAQSVIQVNLAQQ
jgi:hypothetical protein